MWNCSISILKFKVALVFKLVCFPQNILKINLPFVDFSVWVYRVYRIIEVEKTEIYLFLVFLFPLSSELNFLFRDEERKEKDLNYYRCVEGF